VQTSLQTLVAVVEAQMQQVQHQIRDHVTRHPELTRQQAWLTSIPGIGAMTATRLLAEMAPLERFLSARQAAAYTGLTPKHHESGSSVRASHRRVTVQPTHLRLRATPAGTREGHNGGDWRCHAETGAPRVWGAQNRSTL
jgi:hypothetical protein